MSTSDQGEGAWERRRPVRDERYVDERDLSRGRSPDRAPRGAPPPRGPGQFERGSSRGGGRERDEEFPTRTPPSDRERPRGGERDEERTSRRPRPPEGWDRPPASSSSPGASTQRGRPSPQRDRNDGTMYRDRSESSASYGRSGGGGRDMAERDARSGERSGERSMRGPRTPSRDEAWAPPQQRTRANPAAAGAPSSARNKMPPRDDRWDGPDATQRARRPDMSDPRQRSNSANGDPRGRSAGVRRGPYNLQDTAGVRRGMPLQPPPEELPEKKNGFTAGKGFLVILLMIVLGAGAAYGYFKISAPTVHGSSGGTTPSIASPVSSPSAAPSVTTTPHADISGASTVFALAAQKNM